MTARDAGLIAEARKLAERLESLGLKAVFAESCTGGLVSATLARIPGVSAVHCGSAVVYRLDSKARWLGVGRDVLDDPGPVSSQVAEQMVRGVLRRTPEAHVAAAVTGHLGPDAPAELDGVVWIATALRGRLFGRRMRIATSRIVLPAERDAEAARRNRQIEAARLTLYNLRERLEKSLP
ncbi:MAG: nicotinamide-nucleotide amidohydrolase family protein [Planctomycetes bacterium]|nr:nicotinamide-nucleotide amidohydrolase family protein [Planctomycetota bacterium]